MGLRINTNMAAMAARRHLLRTSDQQGQHYQRVASGNRINSAADDAAGLAISENMRSQIRSMNQATRNANDGISLVQVAEGGLTEVGNMLIRLRELSIQSATDTVGDKERGFINQEVRSLLAEIDRIANVTSFNGTSLLNGEGEKGELEFQVGIFNQPSDRITFNVAGNDIRIDTLGVADVNTVTVDDARNALDKIDSAISMVNEKRAGLGAMQNKLHATTGNLSIMTENLTNARSRIADADIAEETSALIKENILQSAGVSVLAQANNAPMQALKLLS